MSVRDTAIDIEKGFIEELLLLTNSDWLFFNFPR